MAERSNGMLKPFMREESRFASIARPEDWEPLQASLSVDLIIAAPAQPGRFRPNVVINSFPYSGSLPKLSTVVIAYARTLVQNLHIISVDEIEVDSRAGRIIEYVHSGGGDAVHSKVLVLQTPEHAVLVTASCAASELSAYDEVLELVSTSVQLKEES